MSYEPLELLGRLKRVLESGKSEGVLDRSLDVPFAEYTDAARYEREHRAVARRHPLPLVPSALVREPGSRVSRDVLGVPLLATRDLDGQLHVFHNRCRHRGAALLGTDECSTGQRLVCPYHGWSYGLDGKAVHIPEQESGWPGLDKGSLSLSRLPSIEVAGNVWVSLDPSHDLEASFGSLRDELDAFDLGAHRVLDVTRWSGDFNWKLGVNAFLETYHFKFAHRDSVARVFTWNRILVDPFGDNLRLSLPRHSVVEQLATLPEESWELRRHVSFVYFVFPCSFLSVLPDHATFVSFLPDGLARTRIESHVFVPEGLSAGRSAESTEAYWERNAALFRQTLAEDIALAASCQKGMAHDDGSSFTFATFEHALAHFRASMQRLTG